MTAKLIETMIILVAVGLKLAGEWKILDKMGEKGWKCLVPFLGEYLIFKHVWNTKMFWFFTVATLPVMAGRLMTELHMTLNIPFAIVELVAAITLAVITVKLAHRLAKAFGHGTGYTLGLLFLAPVFEPVLGFGKSEYAAA